MTVTLCQDTSAKQHFAVFLRLSSSKNRSILEAMGVTVHSPYVHLTSHVHEERAIGLLQGVQVLKELLPENGRGGRKGIGQCHTAGGPPGVPTTEARGFTC